MITRMRVLVIEDYQPLRESVVQGLSENGFAVDATGDGEEGLWYAQSGEYDVILLDLMLPKLDGLAILRSLREGGNPAHVLILTAKDALKDRLRGLNLGADDYLVKPFSLDELLARVRALVRRKYAAKSPVVRVAGLEIDTVARVVRCGGQPIELTAREYAIIEYLALRAGQTVARATIWEHVYDFAAEPNSNVIDVYIARLRKKLRQGGRPDPIHTRRGMGYVLGEPT
jgi:DNA-binding response OmpR family regulator